MIRIREIARTLMLGTLAVATTVSANADDRFRPLGVTFGGSLNYPQQAAASINLHFGRDTESNPPLTVRLEPGMGGTKLAVSKVIHNLNTLNSNQIMSLEGVYYRTHADKYDLRSGQNYLGAELSFGYPAFNFYGGAMVRVGSTNRPGAKAVASIGGRITPWGRGIPQRSRSGN